MLVSVASLVGSSLAFGSTAGSADEDEPTFSRFQRLDVGVAGGGVGAAKFRPGMLDQNGRLKVIVRIAGKPVAGHIGDANSQGRTLTEAQEAALRAELRAAHQPVVAKVQELGGQVLTEYEDAYNGVAALVAPADIAALQATPSVVSVRPAKVFTIENVAGVQYIEAQRAWQETGRHLTGRGVRVAIIDTGVDYTHADFGGPGTEQAFQSNDGTVIEPGTFPTRKVVGGFDFVGDDFNSGATDEEIATDPDIVVPKPDPDPLDCDGHGSHVAGTAAGFGVTSDGKTYRGPYNAGIYGSTNFLIGPGVAPEASIYAYRVFGCSGSTSEEVIVDALNQALKDNVDVVNMSLGSPFGRSDEPSTIASNNLAHAGVVVVASAGNSGASGYITGAPAVADRAISVAAIDASQPFFPGAKMDLSTGQSIIAQNSNGAPLPSGPLEIKVLRAEDGTVSLGCDPNEYQDVLGKLVVTLRGDCARVARAIYGQKAGAAAVAMINTAASYPPFEGEITSNPDTGEKFTVTIPFLGIRGVLGPSPFDDGDLLVAADGGSVTLSPSEVPNLGFQRLATFTSGGPRNVDSFVKPDVTAPGVSVISVGIGTGFKGVRNSGTSMAAPMTAGTAALVTQSHSSWSTERIKAAIMNTADVTGAKILTYNPRLAGAGVVNARRAVDTVGLALAGEGQSTLSYGYEPLTQAYSETLEVRIENTSNSGNLTYNLSAEFSGNPLGATLTFEPSTVTVPHGASATVKATLALSAAAVAELPPAIASNFGAIATIRGAAVASPTTTGPGIYPLRVPFLVAPRGLSDIKPSERAPYTRAPGHEQPFKTTVNLTNGGIHSGTAEIFAWGIDDPDDVAHPEDSMDVRVAGVQVQPREYLCGDDPAGVCGTADDRSLVFAINVYGRASNPAVSEFDIAIDIQNDGHPDFFVVGIDIGSVLGGAFDGRFASLIFNAEGELIDAWVAAAPMNGSTLLLPVLASEVGLSPGDGSTKFTYQIGALSIVPGDLVDITETAGFRVDKPPVSTGQAVDLAPGESATVELEVDQGMLAGSPLRGWLVTTFDDPNGAAQADTIPLGEVVAGK
ncbi:MAG: S8 family serine peptidase [Actinobacteria bacterium]|nr:S8 family serine peptidase [Actinomycetota bacterium]